MRGRGRGLGRNLRGYPQGTGRAIPGPPHGQHQGRRLRLSGVGASAGRDFYGHNLRALDAGRAAYIVSVRFSMPELDARARMQKSGSYKTRRRE